MAMTLTCPAFAAGARMPRRFTGDGADISPPLAWTDPPAGTKCYALICEDPDASGPKPFVHWVLYDIPPTWDTVAEGLGNDHELMDGAQQGVTDFGDAGYGGPAPPPGKPHRYLFRLYAVSKASGLKPGASRIELLAAIKGKVLATAELTGIYSR